MTKNQTPKTTQTARCNCGCGEATSSSKTAYKPGHDARHAGSVARDLAAFWIDGGEGVGHSMLDELPPKLQAKATAQAKRLVERVAEKAGTAERKLAKKTSKADEQTEGSKRAEAFIDGFQGALNEKLAEVVAREEAAHAEQSTPPAPEWDDEFQGPTKWVHSDVKVGRWSYPARQYEDGLIVRNTKRDGSGEWVAYKA